LSGEGCSLTRLSEAAQRLDSCNRDLFLAKAVLVSTALVTQTWVPYRASVMATRTDRRTGLEYIFKKLKLDIREFNVGGIQCRDIFESSMPRKSNIERVQYQESSISRCGKVLLSKNE
jgi:hypothetical protein